MYRDEYLRNIQIKRDAAARSEIARQYRAHLRRWEASPQTVQHPSLWIPDMDKVVEEANACEAKIRAEDAYTRHYCAMIYEQVRQEIDEATASDRAKAWTDRREYELEKQKHTA